MFWIVIIITTLALAFALDRAYGVYMVTNCIVDGKTCRPEPRQGIPMYYVNLKEQDGKTHDYDVTEELYNSIQTGDKIVVTYTEGWLFGTFYSMKMEKCTKEE